MKKAGLISVIILLVAGGACFARTITVDDDGPADFNNIQAAISDANDGDTVLVKDGVYTGQGNRDIADLGKAITVKSENGPENCIIDCNGTESDNHRGFNIQYRTMDGEFILDGFTITNAYGLDDSFQGAIYCYRRSPTIANCIIVGNMLGSGGGIACRNGSPTIINSVINHNEAQYYGGGIYCEESSPIITNCTISGNSATGDGGGIFCEGGSAAIENCTISENSTFRSGGGIYCHSSNGVSIANCTITGNISDMGGAGIYCFDSGVTVTKSTLVGNSSTANGGGVYSSSGDLIITNCVIASNSAGYNGGGLLHNGNKILVTNCAIVGNNTRCTRETRYGGGGIYLWSYSEAVFSNCIIWNNFPAQIKPSSNLAVIKYSNVEGGWPGTGNIDADPRFAFDTDYHLMPNSPCIDAGDPNYIPEPNETDLEGKPRLINSQTDMGPYEYNPVSSTIAISASSVSFHYVQNWQMPKPQTLQIRNCGIGTLNWQIVEDCGWLNVSPISGQSEGQIGQVTVTVEPNSLPVGSYRCPFTILDSSADNSPKTVLVTLNIGALLKVPQDFPTIQAAIDETKDFDMVLVADGTYTGDGNRDITFLRKAITVKSENGPENCIIDCNATEADFRRAFYIRQNKREDSVLDGFTITGYDSYPSYGIISCYESNFTISNCIITGNLGDGIYSDWGHTKVINCIISQNQGRGIEAMNSSLTVYDCVITDNFGGGIKADGYKYCGVFDIKNCIIERNISAGIAFNEAEYATVENCVINSGGGISCSDSTVIIKDCTIQGNTRPSGSGGGIICGAASDLAIVNSIIKDNTAGRGGAISSLWSTLNITNTLISNNSADRAGGGIYCSKSSGGVNNCTFTQNTSPNGNAFACHSFENRGPSNLEITNCILEDGGNEIWNNDGSAIAITYSEIEGGWPGTGNIDSDPCFVSPNDYHLLPTSPCIDTGDPNYTPEPNETDLDGSPRVFNGRIDMGAYEYAPPVEVELTLTPQMLNCDSHGNWLKAHVIMPEGYYPEDIDVNTPVVAEPPGVESEFIEVNEYSDGYFDVQIYFDREIFCEALSESEDGLLEVTVTGSLTDGRKFQGSDTIKLKIQPRHHRIRQNINRERILKPKKTKR